MIQFKLNGKKIQIASSWEDFTFHQYTQAFKITGLSETLSLCSGLPLETIKKAKMEGLESVITAMSFIRKPPTWDTTTLKCGPYTLPVNHKGSYNIQYESLAQFEDSRAILTKVKPEEILTIYPDIVAIYLQKIRDGEYNYTKAQEMIPEVFKMNAREVVTLGSFFIIKLSSLLIGTEANSQNTAQSLKKSKPVSKGSRKVLARSPRSRR